MAKRRMKFTFPPELITRPVIYEIAQRFQVVTNIRRADVAEERGWVVLELDGAAEDIERAVEWVMTLNVRVDPIEGDVVEG
ncbi:MAG: NIL domain-containing protein [Chloroflexi bacterium]|nr:NIL domain-containing protein [Chloroflexota bacterium]